MAKELSWIDMVTVWRKIAGALATGSFVIGLLGVSPSFARSPDVLTQMFAWWNGAIKTPGAFTVAAFGRYFDPETTMIIDGHVSAHGLEDLTRHFQAIQASGAAVEIMLPFKEEFRSGDKIYTYHVINSRLGGKVGCMLAAGHATLRDGKILSLALVRKNVDFAKGTIDPQCWKP